jgi:hypothetical protein
MARRTDLKLGKPARVLGLLAKPKPSAGKPIAVRLKEPSPFSSW